MINPKPNSWILGRFFIRLLNQSPNSGPIAVCQPLGERNKSQKYHRDGIFMHKYNNKHVVLLVQSMKIRT